MNWTFKSFGLCFFFVMIWGFPDEILHKQEEVVNKTRSFEKMKSEAEKCLTQGERLCSEKTEFEDATYGKACLLLYFFVGRMLSCCSTELSLCFSVDVVHFCVKCKEGKAQSTKGQRRFRERRCRGRGRGHGQR